jgi:hypothetical protein
MSSVPLRERETLTRFFLLAYLAALAFCLPFLARTNEGGPTALGFGLAVWGTYPLLYLLPALFATLCARLLLLLLGRGRESRWSSVVPRLVALLATASSLAFLLADARIQEVYGFHVNGFVLNLVTTPGGIESMGAGGSTYRTCAGLALGLLGLTGGLLALARSPWLASVRPPLGALAVLWLVLSAAERVGYGAAHAAGHGPVLAAADAFPLYSRLTFDRLARRLGLGGEYEPGLPVELRGARLDYPLIPLELVPPERALNVLLLVAESLRADALDPAIMPRTWDFARRAVRFARHTSSGNGTRMGVFGLFYGLYGPDWFPALESRRGPVLIDALRAQHYQFSVHTSARFTYPEFDQTVFADVPPADLHEWGEGESWERDRAMVGAVLSFLDGRDPARPFFAFSFFESAHARYAFPEECAVRRPYLADLNYAALDLEHDIELIRNRYLNACHHLDTQLGLLLDGLAARGLLDSTIVVVTGDHGEEFLEHGRWGHGSSFVDEQVHVPLVLWVPGGEPTLVERRTSHLDLPATLLPRLGVRNPPRELSLGHDLLGPLVRDFTVVSDWSRLCVITRDFKASFATQAKGLFRTETSRADDGQAPEGARIPAAILAEVLEGLGRFRPRVATHSAGMQVSDRRSTSGR